MQPIRNSYPQLSCKGCGVTIDAGCDCGVGYIAIIEKLQEREAARRAKQREADQKHKPKRQQKQRSVDIDNVIPFDPIQEPCEDCHDNEERWQRSLQNFASDAIAMRAMWRRHFDSWESFKPSKQTITLAEQASNEWMELVRQLKLRRN